MRTRRWIWLALPVVLLVATGCGGEDEVVGEAIFEQPEIPISDLEVTSEPLTEEPIPARFTCDGVGEPPPFEWTGVPEDTESLALVLDDPDAPDGRFLHWNVTNIDPALGAVTDELENNAPAAEVGPNALGEEGYIPLCPPTGEEHRYVLTLYALEDRRDPADGGALEVREQYAEAALGVANLVFTYER